MRASVRTLARDDYLAVRLKRLAAWARSCSVAELPAQESGEWNGHGLARTLLPLCQSRFFGAAELQALVATGRGQCRVLARPEVLEPVMRQLELGFQELRGLSEALSGRLLWLEEGTYTARENLRFLTSASLQPLRAQMRTGEIANETTLASALLQPAAVLVGDTDYAPDAFAARCLLSEGVGFLTRAAALKPEKVPSAKRRRFRKAFAKYQEHIKAAASGVEAEIFQKLAFWLGMMDAWYEQMPVLMDLSLLKDAVAQHVVPLAAWVLRPHLKPIVGRVVPPPDPPDAVLKDEDLRKLCLSRSSGYPAAPEADGPASPAARPSTGTVPMPARWLKESSSVRDGDPCGASDRVGSDSGTLDYSTDDEDPPDLDEAPETAEKASERAGPARVERILPPMLL
ncbi:unnamed protein product [Durusdinium trenchii]|uniref:Uncharacterized protein n=1 Tax=Durusdinium trenchii TaxID=1381693 RepID=A0ABP0KUI3_9DINO